MWSGQVASFLLVGVGQKVDRDANGRFVNNHQPVGPRLGGRPAGVRDTDISALMKEKWLAKTGKVFEELMNLALESPSQEVRARCGIYIINRWLGTPVAQVASGSLAEFQRFLEEMRAIEANEGHAEGDV